MDHESSPTIVTAEDAPIGVPLRPTRDGGDALNFTLATVQVVTTETRTAAGMYETTMVVWTYETGRQMVYGLGQKVSVQLPPTAPSPTSAAERMAAAINEWLTARGETAARVTTAGDLVVRAPTTGAAWRMFAIGQRATGEELCHFGAQVYSKANVALIRVVTPGEAACQCGPIGDS